MPAGRDPGVFAVAEPLGLLLAGRREIGQLEHRPCTVAPDLDAVARAQGGPVEAGEREVVAVRARERLVALRADALDRLERVEADVLERPTVVAHVEVAVAVESADANPRPADGPLRDPAGRRVDRQDEPGRAACRRRGRPRGEDLDPVREVDRLAT